MPTEILHEDDESIVIQITIPKHSNFVDCENEIQNRLNEVGGLATGRCLEGFDTDGSPIVMGNQKLTAKKDKVPKNYETPYGPVSVARFCYQGTSGGAGHIAMDHNARIIGNSTPRFANMVSHKYSHNNSGNVKRDLDITLNRTVSRCYIQDISTLVANGIEAKDDTWDLSAAEPDPLDVTTVAIGLDGACMLFCEEGYRVAMVGTIALYDAAGDRLHTNYVAAAPEYGKATFIGRMEDEIDRTKEKYPSVRYVGISDGATDFAPWLEKHSTTQILDFWHLTEYLSDAAKGIHRLKKDRKDWLDDTCHRLKHKHGASKEILAELIEARKKPRLSKAAQADLDKAISYLSNALKRTNYASYRKSNLPIGSGVTEAACKTVVKQRLCGSGMKWKSSGADAVLRLRSLALTDGAWDCFWGRIRQFGL